MSLPRLPTTPGLLLHLLVLLFLAPSIGLAQLTISPNDAREYRVLSLENGMKVILVSDPETDKSAAALNVNVGSGSDPDDRAGLAHFLEHMLFLGTEKYPNPGEYQAFIRSHGGSHNAYTAFDDTNYFFDIDSDHLEPALDRFAQFFVAPLFDAKYVEREKNAVHSEYQLKLKDDSWRRLAAYRETLNPEHPYARFSVGALETLEDRPNESVRESLVRFYDRHYSAEGMGLAVLGQESLDTLEGWVREKFSAVRGDRFEPMQIKVPLFQPGDLPAVLEIRPVKNTQRLSLTFPVQSSRPHFRQKPLHFIANLIGHEGEGSLLAALKERHWVESLSAGEGPEIGTESTFEVSMALTDEGMGEIPEIVELFFQSVHLIREKGVKEWLFLEQKQLASIDFRFQESAQPIRYVSSLASLLDRYPTENLLDGPYLFESFDPARINDYLAQLTPSNMLLTITAPDVDVDRNAAWFDTPYRLRAPPENWLQKWKPESAAPVLAIPEPNPYIPEDLALRALDENIERPVGLTVDDGYDHWYMNDKTFRLPRADFFLALRSPVAFDTPKHLVLTKLYLKQLNERLRESTYPAHLAGLEYSISPTLFGVSVQIGGYNDKLEILLEKVAGALAHPGINDARFVEIKADLLRELENALRSRPYERAMAEVRVLLLEPYWTKEEQLAALRDLDADDLRAFVPELLAEYELESLAHGNLTREESLQLTAVVRASLNAPPPEKPVALTRVRRLAEGEGAVRELDVDHGDSALVLYFQGAGSSIPQRARFGLLGQILSTPFYQELRTERQLGYVVFATSSTLLEVPGIMLTIQSPGSSPTTLEKHVGEFLGDFTSSLKTMTVEEFQRQRNALATILGKRAETLSEQTGRYWSEINLNNHEFDTRERLLAALEETTLEDFRSSVEADVLSSNRRELAVAAWGENARSGKAAQDWAERLTVIEPTLFKRGLGFHDPVHGLN